MLARHTAPQSRGPRPSSATNGVCSVQAGFELTLGSLVVFDLVLYARFSGIFPFFIPSVFWASSFFIPSVFWCCARFFCLYTSEKAVVGKQIQRHRPPPSRFRFQVNTRLIESKSTHRGKKGQPSDTRRIQYAAGGSKQLSPCHPVTLSHLSNALYPLCPLCPLLPGSLSPHCS